MSSNNKFATIEDTRYCVFAWNILTQNNLPNQDGAKQLFARCVEIITKLCVINKTCVVQMCEFFPRSANLLGLNINHGERIQIRLRPAHDKTKLFCFEEVLCTCCHELAHNFVGPHNEQFWATYRKFVSQAEEILAATMTGGARGGISATNQNRQQADGNDANPFKGKGHTLGSAAGNNNNNNHNNPNTPSTNPQAFTGAGRRLGGDSSAAIRAARTLGSGEYMRHLVLGGVLKRFFEKDEERIRASQQQQQQQQAAIKKGGNDVDVDGNHNTTMLPHPSPSCGCGSGASSELMHKGATTNNQSANRNNTQQQTQEKQQEQRNVVDDDDFSWPCDLCGRTVRGQFCNWCCGNDDDELMKQILESSIQQSSSSSIKKNENSNNKNDDDSMMIMKLPTVKEEKSDQTKKRNDDDDDDDDGEVIVVPNSSKEAKQQSAEDRRRTREAAEEVIELD